jgi:hypothetical protein
VVDVFSCEHADPVGVELVDVLVQLERVGAEDRRFVVAVSDDWKDSAKAGLAITSQH